MQWGTSFLALNIGIGPMPQKDTGEVFVVLSVQKSFPHMIGDVRISAVRE
jgi:hypothetical protein